MTDYSDLARRFDLTDGSTVIDYFPLHLPVQLLSIDVVGIEMRSTPAITEFCLKAIRAGLRDAPSISSFLGLDPTYGTKLLESLSDSEHLSKDPFGGYSLARRGSELLRQGAEELPSDRRIQVLWDPIRRLLLDRTIVYTKQRADRAGIVVPMPGAFMAPKLAELSAADINRIRTTVTSQAQPESKSFEVLRVTSIVKTFGRYRSSLALVQKGAQGELALRLVINGVIDQELTAAYANAGLSKLIGVQSGISNRPGVQAVRKRQSDLICGSDGNINIGKLVQRRSVLSFGMKAVGARLSEEHVESLVQKYEEYKEELARIQQELNRSPVLPVRCYEIDYYLRQALESAEESVTITTTNPSGVKIDGELLQAFRFCLNRRVMVRVYISDRLGDNDPVLAILDKMSREQGLIVKFLQNEARSVFEIVWDDKNLVVANEPILGDRRYPIAPREFSGFYVTDKAAVKRYSEGHLKFGPQDFLTRFVSNGSASTAGKSSLKRVAKRTAKIPMSASKVRG